VLIALFCFLLIIPPSESLVYRTEADGKIGSITVASKKDSSGYLVLYVSDREITAVLDTTDLSTRYIKKVIDGELVLEGRYNGGFNVYFNGHEYHYKGSDPIYDRHTLDFALRQFDYHLGFKELFRLHVPELTIVNAELEVLGETTVSTDLGIIDCWEVQMKPRVIFTNRRFFFYIEREYPHRFVKYTDSSGKNIITLIKYKS
jgi:hypothetical protein